MYTYTYLYVCVCAGTCPRVYIYIYIYVCIYIHVYGHIYIYRIYMDIHIIVSYCFILHIKIPRQAGDWQFSEFRVVGATASGLVTSGPHHCTTRIFLSPNQLRGQETSGQKPVTTSGPPNYAFSQFRSRDVQSVSQLLNSCQRFVADSGDSTK